MRGSQTPAVAVAPEAEYNDWADVRDLCAAYGLVLDPWQETVLKAGLGETASGHWAATRVGLSVPRQCGKTAIFEARELAGLLLFGEELIIHSAHLVSTAIEGFYRIKGYFENYDDLRRKVRRVREANGEQAVEMMTGQRLMFRARARGGGRGLSPDVLMMDEAQILPERAWSAALPSVSARPNYQAWLAGTPPGPEDDSEAFTRIRRAAIAEKDKRLAWLEWAADLDDDPGDPETWAKANPGLGIRISQTTIADEYHSMSPGAFALERLGQWPRDDESNRVISSETWAALVAAGPPDGTPPTALAVDMSHDRVLVIAGCWATGEDRHHLELLHLDDDGDTLTATQWLIERARSRRIPVVIDAFSPAASMIPALKTARVRVVQSSGNDLAKACGLFYDDATAARLTHGVLSGIGQPMAQKPLATALAGAKKRAIGTAGGWGWDRKDPAVNIAPLVAVTLARFGASTVRAKNPNRDRSTDGRTAILL